MTRHHLSRAGAAAFTLTAWIMLAAALASPLQAGVNVLVIGSSVHFDEREAGPQESRLDLEALAAELEHILNRGNRNGATKVFFEDIYRTKDTPTALGSRGSKIPTQFHCHSLAQYYFWPERRAERLKLLKGESGTSWDYAVIVGDPYLIDQMPGIYAEGVKLIADALKTNAQTKLVLLMPWLEDGASNANIKEVLYRIGRGLDIPVAPAGESYAGSMSRHDATYLAAASVFSRFSEALAWAQSSSQSRLARQVATTIVKNRELPEFKEPYSKPTPFTMDFLENSTLTFNQTGTSSERGIKQGLIEAMRQCGLSPREVKKLDQGLIDFNYGRGNSGFEPNKRYQVAPEKFRRSYGFPMQEARATAAVSMLYGIDKRYFNAKSYDDGTDLGIAYDMCRDNEVEKNVRAVPIRLMWAKILELDPTLPPLRDNWHMSRLIDSACGAYMITLLTGKDTRGEEPGDRSSPEWKAWKARAIGYETAMRMGLSFGGY